MITIEITAEDLITLLDMTTAPDNGRWEDFDWLLRCFYDDGGMDLHGLENANIYDEDDFKNFLLYKYLSRIAGLTVPTGDNNYMFECIYPDRIVKPTLSLTEWHVLTYTARCTYACDYCYSMHGVVNNKRVLELVEEKTGVSPEVMKNADWMLEGHLNCNFYMGDDRVMWTPELDAQIREEIKNADKDQ